MKTGQRLIREIDAAEVKQGQCAFWWLGQHGFVVKLGRVICYIDAFLAPHRKRRVPPLLLPEEVTNADLVLGCRHKGPEGDPVDHVSPPTLAFQLTCPCRRGP